MDVDSTCRTPPLNTEVTHTQLTRLSSHLLIIVGPQPAGEGGEAGVSCDEVVADWNDVLLMSSQ